MTDKTKAQEALDRLTDGWVYTSTHCEHSRHVDLQTIRTALTQAEKVEGLVRALTKAKDGIDDVLKPIFETNEIDYRRKTARRLAIAVCNEIDEAIAVFREGK